jgi:hypothetical protein
MGKLELCIPWPRLIAVPKPPKLSVVQTLPQAVAQQAPAIPMMAPPMMAPPMMAAPMMAPPMMAPQMMPAAPAAAPAAAPPACRSADEQTLAALMLLSAQQRGQAQSAPAAAPDNRATLEDQTTRLEQRLDALCRKLEDSGSPQK